MFDKMYADKQKSEAIVQNKPQMGQGHPFEKRQYYSQNKNNEKTNLGRNTSQNVPLCYHCGQPGHYVRNCYGNPNRHTANTKQHNEK